ncbi:MAG: hypothetical protein J0L96_07315 [Anaerolineae bacterium]|nr:hypothetical protein [Anaerolineae bacterium]
MSDLRRSFFWVAFYLFIILVLGLLDRSDTPIINFASYFYLTSLLAVTIMVFVPYLHKVPVVIPMVFWGAIYFALLRLIDRATTAALDVEIVLLEMVLLEAGVWISYQLAVAIERSESLMDILAQGTFPNRGMELEKAGDVIKTEFGRSRRYHRPLSLLIINAIPKDEESIQEMLKSLQRDILTRLSNARIGQAVSSAIRQTDLLMRDQVGRYIVLCPETNLESANSLGVRLLKIVEERTGLHVTYGASAFPDEALTFEDLLLVARERSEKS